MLRVSGCARPTVEGKSLRSELVVVVSVDEEEGEGKRRKEKMTLEKLPFFSVERLRES
jgi:hypothetical protein